MKYKNPILYVSLKQHNPHISLIHVGYDKCEKNYCYGPAVRDAYLIHFVISGKGTYLARNKTYHVEKNQAFIIYPDEITTYIADENDPWSYSFISFNGSMCEELISRTGFANGSMLTAVKDDIFSDTIIETTNNLLNNSQKNPDIYGLSQLFIILKNLMDQNNGSCDYTPPLKDYVQRAIDYIQLKYASPITISSIAKTIPINRSYLYRIFKAEVGISPIEYLNNYRIDQAKRLIVASNMPISQIAMATGFNSFSSFYRMFLMKYGVSPREYKKNFNENTDEPGSS